MRLPFRFSAPWWAWLLTAVLVALFLRLGVWQMHRAEEKKGMISAYQQAAKSAPLELETALAAGEVSRQLYSRAIRVSGRFDSTPALLLDNQVSAQQPGYHVWTPLRLLSGQLVVVNRGWVPMNPDRRILPTVETPPGEVSLRGVWQPLPRPGLRIGVNSCVIPPLSSGQHVVQYPLFEELRCILGSSVLDGVLWLDPAEPHGFVREWAQNDLPPERHYGYALQWLSLAATLLVLFIVINLRRTGS